MKNNYINSYRDIPFIFTLSLISSKWKMTILYQIIESKVIRCNELQKKICNISHRTLSAQLKELENDGLINKNRISPNTT